MRIISKATAVLSRNALQIITVISPYYDQKYVPQVQGDPCVDLSSSSNTHPARPNFSHLRCWRLLKQKNLYTPFLKPYTSSCALRIQNAFSCANQSSEVQICGRLDTRWLDSQIAHMMVKSKKTSVSVSKSLTNTLVSAPICAADLVKFEAMLLRASNTSPFPSRH